MKQDFRTEELQAALEGALGFRISSMTRLDGGCALNFRAVRAGDGYAFSVKCSPPERQELFEHLVRHLADLKGTKAVRRVFEESCPPTFRGYNVLCLDWCRGERRFPDTLSDSELRDFLDDYLAFSDAMQRTSRTMARLPFAKMREDVLGHCRGLGGWLLRRLVGELVPAKDVEYDIARVRLIHGDFHHGNFLFADGRVTGYFDLEEFRKGYPAEDIVRYFVCAAEHLRWYDARRRRRIMAQFGAAVRRLPYPPGDWRLAVSGFLLQKVYKNAGARPPGLFRALNLCFRARLYRRLLRIVGEALGDGRAPAPEHRRNADAGIMV